MLKVFSHYIPRSLVILVLIEAALFYFAVFFGIEIRFMDVVHREESILLLQPVN
ncbi:hypothetical protein MNBD_GAMMA07-2356, partial [hydrothermal vent metagenome]